MNEITPADILANGPNGRSAAKLAFQSLNNAGEGFDPIADEDAWAWVLVRKAESTDDIAVYTFTDDGGDGWIILVGTDGSGDGAWGVRVGDAGVAV